MGQIVALDSMIFIYLLDEDERFWDKVEALFDRIESGEIKAVTSIVSVIEILSPDKYLDDNQTKTEISRFFQETPGLAVFPVDWEISQKAAELRRENRSLRTPDAIQLATAIIGGADIFITNDRKLRSLKLGSLKVRSI